MASKVDMAAFSDLAAYLQPLCGLPACLAADGAHSPIYSWFWDGWSADSAGKPTELLLPTRLALSLNEEVIGQVLFLQSEAVEGVMKWRLCRGCTKSGWIRGEQRGAGVSCGTRVDALVPAAQRAEVCSPHANLLQMPA